MKFKRSKTFKSKSKQHGLASLMFVLIFPALFGVFVWGTEGARIMQDDARLTDAMEVAGLAVAAQNSDDNSIQQATAKKFLQAYFPNSTTTINTPSVTKLTCEQNANCDANDPNVARFFEYRITASVTQDTWFDGGNDYVGYGKQYSVSDKSVARKYQSQAVDVVLVADYSGSMYNYWDGGPSRKYKDLNNIIAEVANELKKFNEQNVNQVNKIAVVPFSSYTSEKVQIGKNKTETRFAAHIYCGTGSSSNCDDYRPGVNGSAVNASKTVDLIFSSNDSIHQYDWKSGDVYNKALFENIYLTSQFDDVVDKIKNTSFFYIYQVNGTTTASYTGLIKAAQVAASGTNPRRLIIILSDGEDTNSSITDALINAGLCTRIIEGLSSLTTSDGNYVKAKLAAVGFDYDVVNNPQMAKCVGENDVYKAENSADIKNKILELISEEIGHLAE